MLLWKWTQIQKMSLSKLSAKEISKKLPQRPKDANKGTFGKVLVIAGSQNYPGAAYLACASSYRVGAGLVTLATIPYVQKIVAKKLPEVTYLILKEADGVIDANADVLLFGPGLGQKQSTIDFMRQLLKLELPKTIIDADGLNVLSKIDRWWEQLKTETVLTPHPGEMSKLTGLSVGKIQSDRFNVAQHFAKLWKQIVVLKGADTIIASPTKVAISPFANPALATAGTGDVLAGCISGFLAQGLKPFDSGCCGVYVHGLAGEMAREKYGDGGMIASDLLPLLPATLITLHNQTRGQLN